MYRTPQKLNYLIVQTYFCKNCDHTATDNLCNKIIQCCLEAGAQCIPSHIVTGNAIAGWNDHVKQAREQSLLWHFILRQSDRPNHRHINIDILTYYH